MMLCSLFLAYLLRLFGEPDLDLERHPDHDPHRHRRPDLQPRDSPSTSIAQLRIIELSIMAMLAGMVQGVSVRSDAPTTLFAG